MTPFLSLPVVYMPAFCVLFFLALLVSVHCLIAAVLYRVPGRRIRQCGMLVLAALVPMTVLTEGCSALYDGEVLSTGSAFLMRVPTALLALLGVALLAAGVFTLIRLIRWRRAHISRLSIKESVDLLPTGLCFGYADGLPRLINQRMDALSHALTGGALSDMEAFWQALSNGRLSRGNTLIRAGESPIVQLADGTVWTLERTPIELDGAAVIQLTATDTTNEYRLTNELAEENRRLREMNQRLRRYGETVGEVTREKEMLSVKARVHDEMGQALLASRRLLSMEAPPDEAESTIAYWRRCVSLLRRENVCEPVQDGYAQLTSAAKAIGVSILWRGTRPRAETDAARILLSAAHECLTNAVRHAGSTELLIQMEHGDGWTFLLTNDGEAPRAPIQEGGGLSSLRRKAEEAGGKMLVWHAPRFKLALTMPDGCEVEA